MKKLLLTLMICCLCSTAMAAGILAQRVADGTMNRPADTANWEISMMPKEEMTKDQIEAAKWSLLLENEVGVYVFNNTTVAYGKKPDGSVDTNVVEVEVKTAITNKELLKKLNVKYADKMSKKDTLSYTLTKLALKRTEKEYATLTLQAYSKKGKVVESKTNKQVSYKAIPAGSFAEALLENMELYLKDYDAQMRSR